MDLTDKFVVVAGMAKSGFAAVNFLLSRGARVRAVDLKPTDEMRAQLVSLGVALLPQEEPSFEGADILVLAPGVPADLPVFDPSRKRGIPILGEVELASYFLKGTTIGITGSNGKTTTTALAGHILRRSGVACQVGGNIGVPVTSMIDSSRDGQWNVLELSSFQLETIVHFHAGIAVALNVTGNHLDRHPTFDIYASAKARLFETQAADSHAVLNADNAVSASYAAKTRGEVHWFSVACRVDPGAYLDGGTIHLDGQPLMEAREIPLRGRHNIENVMAAAIASGLAGAPFDQIAAAVRTFPGVEHRLEFVRRLDGVDWFNDSKATSVDAALKAIDAFPGELWVILGGKHKGIDYTPLREPLSKKAHMALLIGAAAPILAEQLHGALPLVPCGTLDAAVAEARRRAQPGDTVLLAPACSSYDQFISFEHRGQIFKSLVTALQEGSR